MESTLLQANEISCRIQQISEKGLSLLLYVTSRDGQKRLDEKYGPLGWQDKYEVIDGDLYCIISAWDEAKQMWIANVFGRCIRFTALFCKRGLKHPPVGERNRSCGDLLYHELSKP